MRCTIVALVTLKVCISAGGSAWAEDGSGTAASASDAQIRAARAQFNEAIRTRDVDGIGRFLVPSYHIVTGRSAQSHGAANEVQSWRGMLLADPSFECTRLAGEISVNDRWGLAQELGRWICNGHAEGEPWRSAGVYSAKWQRAESGRWLLQAEVFTTLECGGAPAGCRAPDPIEE